MQESAWRSLFDQASALFARELPEVQLLAVVAALVIVGMMLQAIGSVVPRRRKRAMGLPPAPAKRTAASPAHKPKQVNRKRKVRRVRRDRVARPKIRRTGEPGYLADDSALQVTQTLADYFRDRREPPP